MTRKIGETFKCLATVLKVIKCDDEKKCKKCYLYNNDNCLRQHVAHIVGECGSYYRKDNESVIFVNIKEPEAVDDIITIPIPPLYKAIRDEGDKIILRRKEKILPHDFDGCMRELQDMQNFVVSFIVPSTDVHRYLALGQILACRNAWWKSLGWVPDWSNHEEAKYCIHAVDGLLVSIKHSKHPRILAFPTPEICDEFLKAFCDLIEEAKELL